jgi:hypothetical protein
MLYLDVGIAGKVDVEKWRTDNFSGPSFLQLTVTLTVL